MAKYELPKLPYAYNALEPHIDAQTMEIHHTKHHQAYTNGLNTALEGLSAELQNMELTKLLASLDKVPENVRGAVNFHGGGYDNHTLFWNNMKPNGGGEPGGSVADAIKSSFGGFAQFKEKFEKQIIKDDATINFADVSHNEIFGKLTDTLKEQSKFKST